VNQIRNKHWKKIGRLDNGYNKYNDCTRHHAWSHHPSKRTLVLTFRHRCGWDTSVAEVKKSIPCASSEKSEYSSELKRIESSCSWIPGALVIDPLVRDMVQEGGMRVTENAIWLLVVAMKEHTKNILKNAISHKEAVEKGQILSRTLRYPKLLAGNSKNSAKRDSTQDKTSAPSVTQQQEAIN
jgi:hypothetical protein